MKPADCSVQRRVLVLAAVNLCALTENWLSDFSKIGDEKMVQENLEVYLHFPSERLWENIRE
jgi:hypothetical protein